jgi:hypothetical protein
VRVESIQTLYFIQTEYNSTSYNLYSPLQFFSVRHLTGKTVRVCRVCREFQFVMTNMIGPFFILIFVISATCGDPPVALLLCHMWVLSV